MRVRAPGPDAHGASLQRFAAATDDLRAPRARLHVDVHDRTVAITVVRGFDDAVEIA